MSNDAEGDLPRMIRARASAIIADEKKAGNGGRLPEAVTARRSQVCK